MPIEFDFEIEKPVSVWSGPEKQFAWEAVKSYGEWFDNNLRKPIISILELVPSRISEDWNKVNSLREALHNEKPIEMELLPIIKTALLMARQNKSEVVEKRSRRSLDPQTISRLRSSLDTFDQIFEVQTLNDQNQYVPPKITDYLSIYSAEEALAHSDSLRFLNRKLDDKFGIPLAPDLFAPDLTYYRSVFGLRNVPICVAYIDVDDFKNLNTKYTETHID